MLRFNITLRQRSLVPASSRFGFALLAVCAVAGCSVYGPDLMEGGALSGGGADGKSGGSNGGTASSSGGTSAAGESSNNGGSATSGGSAHGGSGNGGSSTGGTGASSAGTSAGGSSAAGATGMAGSATGGSGGAAGGSNLDLIDNLEDDDAQIRLLNNPKRDGIWDSGNDGVSSGGMQTPAPGMFKPIALLSTEAPYAGDKYAAYSKASGYTQYAFMNVSMRSWPTYDTTYPKYDASANKGIQFLAKAGAGSSLGVHVRFISGDTDPRGGKCALPATPTPPDVCYNHFYAPVTLSNEWATYTLSFADDFFQPVSSDTPIDLTEMYGLEFYFGPSDDYELWVDDLSFVKN